MKTLFKTYYLNGKKYSKIGNTSYLLEDSIVNRIKKLTMKYFGNSKIKFTNKSPLCFIICIDSIYKNNIKYFNEEIVKISSKTYSDFTFIS
jgi:hypothetical protein